MVTLIILLISIVLNIALAYAVWNVLKKNEMFEEFVLEMYQHARMTQEEMVRIDTLGAFEADDDVGVTFRLLKEAIDRYVEFIGIEDEEEEEQTK